MLVFDLVLLLIYLLTTPPGEARWRDTRIKNSGKDEIREKKDGRQEKEQRRKISILSLSYAVLRTN